MNPQNDYLKSLVDQFWNYAEAELIMEGSILDREQRDQSRPPVFRKAEAARNILIPPDANNKIRAKLEATIPVKERHQWFRSMKSSQALAQSVFGNLIVSGHLDVLTDLESDEGLLAFCDDIGRADVELEYSVQHLGEPRSTSVDVWITGSSRIAVECKLTEPDFGTCSRPRLKQGKDKNYQSDYCDGSYTRQKDRRSRCSLTEIGVNYWDHVPSLFHWNNNIDLVPCPLSNTYQLVRNVLAACISPDGRVNSNNAHVLIIYDKRNPSFQDGGRANQQWKAAKAALKTPELLRSCSWQSILEHLDQSDKLVWLVDQLKRKYGF